MRGARTVQTCGRTTMSVVKKWRPWPRGASKIVVGSWEMTGHLRGESGQKIAFPKELREEKMSSSKAYFSPTRTRQKQNGHNSAGAEYIHRVYRPNTKPSESTKGLESSPPECLARLHHQDTTVPQNCVQC